MSEPALPALLQPVVLAPGSAAGSSLDARVLDVEPGDGGRVTVVLSRVPGDVAWAERAVVVWTAPGGRYERPVTLRRGRRMYGPVWLAVPDGPAVRTQRRAHFRAEVHLPVRLDWTDPPAGPEDDGDPAVVHHLDAVAADLSEGGLLATVRRPAPAVGTEIDVTVVIEGEPLTQRGRVVRQVSFPGGGLGVALAFSDPARHGDRIRRTTFAAQRRRLAAGQIPR